MSELTKEEMLQQIQYPRARPIPIIDDVVKDPLVLALDHAISRTHDEFARMRGFLWKLVIIAIIVLACFFGILLWASHQISTQKETSINNRNVGYGNRAVACILAQSISPKDTRLARFCNAIPNSAK